jgi:predicted cupin superfamily sugar epimerase
VYQVSVRLRCAFLSNRLVPGTPHVTSLNIISLPPQQYRPTTFEFLHNKQRPNTTPKLTSKLSNDAPLRASPSIAKMSSIPNTPSKLTPTYISGTHPTDSPSTASIISTLGLEKNIEGGYFSEIDRNPLLIPNPFSTTTNTLQTAEKPQSGDNSIRNASTSIYYLLTPHNPQGHFHRNKGRTVHTVIEGRGVYVLIHADEDGVNGKKRMESFVVGKDVTKGEKAVWIVEGGKFKASFLLAANGDGKAEAEGDRLLISEVSLTAMCDFFFEI